MKVDFKDLGLASVIILQPPNLEDVTEGHCSIQTSKSTFAELVLPTMHSCPWRVTHSQIFALVEAEKSLMNFLTC